MHGLANLRQTRGGIGLHGAGQLIRQRFGADAAGADALRQLLLGGGMIAALAGIGNAKVNAAGQGQHKQHGQHTGTRPGIG